MKPEEIFDAEADWLAGWLQRDGGRALWVWLTWRCGIGVETKEPFMHCSTLDNAFSASSLHLLWTLWRCPCL